MLPLAEAVWSPFAQAGSTDVGRLLLDSNADLTLRNQNGDQAVHVAASHGRVVFVDFLVDRGADMDSVNDDGLSARHLLNLFQEVNAQQIAE